MAIVMFLYDPFYVYLDTRSKTNLKSRDEMFDLGIDVSDH